jgi:hypothetical protein
MKLAVFTTLTVLSFSAFANPFDDLADAIERLVGVGEFVGTSSDGGKCKVSFSPNGQASVISYAPGCVDEAYNTVALKCFSDFNFNQSPSRMQMKKLELKAKSIVAEVKSKDSEQYSSSKTALIEVQATSSGTIVRISSDKKFMGGYKKVLSCRL